MKENRTIIEVYIKIIQRAIIQHKQKENNMAYNLLEKSELWIHNLKLNQVNLSDLAKAVADVIKVDTENVLVVDVRDNHITLDILEDTVEEKNIIGKEQEILNSIAAIPGVTISEETEIASNGILGMINFTDYSQEEIEISQNRVNNMVENILDKLSKRVLVYPTGFEVKDHMIEDTNTPYIQSVLENKGYKVSVGEVIEDELADMVNKLDDALNRGFELQPVKGGHQWYGKTITAWELSDEVKEKYNSRGFYFDEDKELLDQIAQLKIEEEHHGK